MKEYAIFIACEEDKNPNFGGRYILYTEEEVNAMDGTGCCARDFDNRDMRPLNDVFPVKSGKKAR